MSKFIKYMGSAHLNNHNVALYENDKGACLKAEQVVTDKSLGEMQFSSIEEAKDWYYGLPGNELGQLDNALDELIE